VDANQARPRQPVTARPENANTKRLPVPVISSQPDSQRYARSCRRIAASLAACRSLYWPRGVSVSFGAVLRQARGRAFWECNWHALVVRLCRLWAAGRGPWALCPGLQEAPDAFGSTIHHCPSQPLALLSLSSHANRVLQGCILQASCSSDGGLGAQTPLVHVPRGQKAGKMMQGEVERLERR
jgi:hypothetical protein